MKKYLLIAALGIFALASCQRENLVEPGDATFTATTEGGTKTSLVQDGDVYKVLWKSGDKIVIVDHDGNSGIYVTKDSDATAVFTLESGSQAAKPNFNAVYPTSIFTGSALLLPAVQTYTEGTLTEAPMIASSSTTSLQFKNVCGAMRLNLSTTQAGIKVRKIILTADKGLSGEAWVTNDAAVPEGKDGVTLDCGEDGVAIGETALPFFVTTLLKLDEGVVLDLDSDKHTVIDYKIEHSLDDKYQAAIRLSGTKDNISRFFFIIENNTNFSVDDNIFAPNSFDYYTLPKEPKFEYVKTYTSGGHTYDLYKVNYTISSFGGATKYEAFAAVRKDQQSGGRLRGAVDVTDHLININDEELSTTPLTEFTLAIDTKLSTGSIEAAHAISFDTEVASEEIIGDFNGDNTIDSLDLIVARKALIAQFSDDAKPAPNKPASKKMDVNKNGSFEIADIVMLQSFVMGKINTFPEA